MSAGSPRLWLATLLALLALPVAAIEPPPAATAPLPASPVNLDFEQGEVGKAPVGWLLTSSSRDAGFGVELTEERPAEGRRCAVMRSIYLGGRERAGNLMQSFDAAAYLGRRARFRAAVRTEGLGPHNQARLWLAVERRNHLFGFFDSMADRPITAGDWKFYDLVGEVDPDAERIAIGLLVTGDGRVWIDAASFTALGPAGEGKVAPRPLAARGLANLEALTRLLGYVRYFHPSDEAEQTDWGRFALAAVEAAEPAADSAQLAAVLDHLFAPIAPTLRVYPSGLEPPALELKPEGTTTVVAWRHTGLGSPGRPSIFFSSRLRYPTAAAASADPAAPLIADLGGGVSCRLPLALYADRGGTLPRPAQPPPGGERRGPAPGDRSTHLAVVALAWNMVQHFDPLLDEPGTDWQAALRQALQAAATAPDEAAFLTTLRRMLANLRDGQANVSSSTDSRVFGLPIRWDWIVDRLVISAAQVTGASAGPAAPASSPRGASEAGAPRETGGLAPGDVVVRLDGREPRAAIAAEEALAAASTSQWRRRSALAHLALGTRGEPLLLEVVSPQGSPRAVTLRRVVSPTNLDALFAPRQAVREARPGIFVVDLAHLTASELNAALPKLESASGIVFDLRSSARLTGPVLAHLIDQPLATDAELVPTFARPDRMAVRYQLQSNSVEPAAPRLRARLAFLSSDRDVGEAEGLLATVARLELGAIVGSPTGGARGSIDSALLPTGYTLLWTGTRAPGPPGPDAVPLPIPVAAVQPTIGVAPTPEGLAAGRDEVLDRALDLVAQPRRMP
ncbi:MAG TPA: hypothetical protein VHR45_21940 [Thermoanaerobaculia bacterium]|nr:hypothetical protein [Thermoanaerobaculia bacterium]